MSVNTKNFTPDSTKFFCAAPIHHCSKDNRRFYNQVNCLLSPTSFSFLIYKMGELIFFCITFGRIKCNHMNKIAAK